MGVFGQIRQAAKSCWQFVSAGRLRSDHMLSWKPAGHYQSYMIRFWRTNATVPWRAAVVDPRQDSIHYFSDREALYAFLDAQIDNHDVRP